MREKWGFIYTCFICCIDVELDHVAIFVLLIVMGRTVPYFSDIEHLFNVEFVLKAYSVILITSFYDTNQQILRSKGYIQNFS